MERFVKPLIGRFHRSTDMAEVTLTHPRRIKHPKQPRVRTHPPRPQVHMEDEFRPVLRRMSAQITADTSQRTVVEKALKGCLGHLLECHDPSRHGPLHPYVLRQLSAFMAGRATEPP